MNTTRPKMFIAAMMLAAAAAAAYTSSVSHERHGVFALAVLILAAATSRMKAKMPGLNGNMSVNLPFLLTAIVSLSSAEAIAITCLSTAVQCWPRKNAQFNPEQMAFNLSMMTFASSVAGFMFHASALRQWGSASLPLAAAMLFLGQTVPVATIISLSESKAIAEIWWKLAHLSFPYYVLSAGICGMVQTVSNRMGWELALGVFPMMYGVHRSYRMYFDKMAETQRVPVLVRAAGA